MSGGACTAKLALADTYPQPSRYLPMHGLAVLVKSRITNAGFPARIVASMHLTEQHQAEFAELAKQKIAEFNALHWDASLRQPLGLAIHDDAGNLLGALAGRTFGNWFYLESFWLAAELRGKGQGSVLLHRAEQIACARGCRYVVLDTLDFQARPFYEKHGYQLEWTQQDYPFAGGAKYFMSKVL